MSPTAAWRGVVLLGVFAGTTTAQESRGATSRRVDTRLEREGAATRPSSVVDYVVAEPGFLSAWAVADDGAADLRLELHDGARVLADDDSGGGADPWIGASFPPSDASSAYPRNVRITVAAADGAEVAAAVSLVFVPREPLAEQAVARRRSEVERLEKEERDPPEPGSIAPLADLLAAAETTSDRELLLLLSRACAVRFPSYREREPGDDVGLRATRRVLDGLHRLLPAGHLDVVDARRNHAIALAIHDAYDEALVEADRALAAATRLRACGPARRGSIALIGALIEMRAPGPRRTRSTKAAERYLRAESEYLRSGHPTAGALVLNARACSGTNFNLAGRHAEALEVLERGVAQAREDPSLPAANVFWVRAEQADARHGAGDLAGAYRDLRRLLGEAALLEKVDPGHVDEARCTAARIAAEAGDVAGATALTRRLAEDERRAPPADPVWYDMAAASAVAAATEHGEYELALELVFEWIAAREARPAVTPSGAAVRLGGLGVAMLLGDYELVVRWSAETEAFGPALPVDAPLKSLRSQARNLGRMARNILRAAGTDSAPELASGRDVRGDPASIGLAAAADLASGAAGPEAWERIERSAKLLRFASDEISRTLADTLDLYVLMRSVLGMELSEGRRAIEAASSRRTKSAIPGDLVASLHRMLSAAIAARRAVFDATTASDLRAVAEAAAVRLRAQALRLSSRQAASCAAQAVDAASFLVQCAPHCGDAKGELLGRAWSLVEGARAAPLVAARAARTAAAAASDRVAEARAELAAAEARTARLAASGSRPAALAEALRVRDDADRALRDVLRGLAPGLFAHETLLEDPSRCVAALGGNAAFVGYFRWRRTEFDFARGPEADRRADRYGAFVVVATAAPTFVDLGAAESVDAAIRRLATGSEAGVRGVDDAAASRPDFDETAAEDVRRIVWDPVAATTPGARRFVVACDGDVALVPLDALPTKGGRVGDDVEISVITSLLDLLPSPARPARRPLLAVGGVDYDAAPGSRPASRPGSIVPRDARTGSLAPLPGAAEEAAAIVSVMGDPEGALLLTGADATKGRFLAEAPSARVLHVATHGLFAPDSVALVGRTPGLGGDPKEFSGARDLVVGFAPFLLAGLAFAGANHADAANGRDGALLTAAELAAVDLSSCELATLSACESAAGRRRRAGDLTSLRQALHAAGVRHALTSLWKVPDAATRDLMIEFHRRRTRLGEEPHRALREAKRALREARDPATGAPLRRFRDWAGWVLTGAPAP